MPGRQSSQTNLVLNMVGGYQGGMAAIGGGRSGYQLYNNLSANRGGNFDNKSEVRADFSAFSAN